MYACSFLGNTNFFASRPMSACGRSAIMYAKCSELQIANRKQFEIQIIARVSHHARRDLNVFTSQPDRNAEACQSLLICNSRFEWQIAIAPSCPIWSTEIMREVCTSNCYHHRPQLGNEFPRRPKVGDRVLEVAGVSIKQRN